MRIVLASGRIPGRPGQLLRGVLNGLLLGLMSDEHLRRLDEHYYRRDMTYRSVAWNEHGLAGWERNAVKRSFASHSRITVVASGGGREVLALLLAGFDATGYEPHPDLHRFAQGFLAANGYPGRALPMPRDNFPYTGRVDGVLVGWGGYSLIAPRARRVRFLSDAAATMPSGGGVLLSVFARVLHGRELQLTSRLASALRRIRGEAPIELGDTLAPNRVHVFTTAELRAEFDDAGIELESCGFVGAADSMTSYACATGRTR